MHLSHSKNTKENYNVPYSNTNRRGYRGHYNFRGSQRAIPRNLSRRNFHSKDLSLRRQSPRFGRGQSGSRQVNPPDHLGNPSRCDVCGSIFHWATNCPDSGGNQGRKDFSQKVSMIKLYVNLYINDYRNSHSEMETLVGDFLGSAVTDCGATKTICGIT